MAGCRTLQAAQWRKNGTDEWEEWQRHNRLALSHFTLNQSVNAQTASWLPETAQGCNRGSSRSVLLHSSSLCSLGHAPHGKTVRDARRIAGLWVSLAARAVRALDRRAVGDADGLAVLQQWVQQWQWHIT